MKGTIPNASPPYTQKVWDLSIPAVTMFISCETKARLSRKPWRYNSSRLARLVALTFFQARATAHSDKTYRPHFAARYPWTRVGPARPSIMIRCSDEEVDSLRIAHHCDGNIRVSDGRRPTGVVDHIQN